MGCCGGGDADVAKTDKKTLPDTLPAEAAKATPAPDKIKLYGMAISTCSRRAMMVMEEKNVPYELIMTNLMAGEHKAPDFTVKQPFGQIPVMEDGDLTLFESRAICRYICNKFASQGTELLGKDLKAKAAVDTWLEVEANQFNGPVSTLVYENVFKGMFNAGPPDEALVAEQYEKLNKVLDVYEAILSKQQYLTGDAFTLADLSHLPYTGYMFENGMSAPFDKHPAVKAWWDRISTRPTWVKLTAK